jgi:hypothetical protein
MLSLHKANWDRRTGSQASIGMHAHPKIICAEHLSANSRLVTSQIKLCAALHSKLIFGMQPYFDPTR